MGLKITSVELDPTVGDIGTPAEGEIWYNDTTNKYRGNEGGSTVDLKTTAAADITDFNTAVASTPPQAHSASHSDGGSDEISIEDLATAETVTSKVLRPDGAGGVNFVADAGTGDVVGPASAVDGNVAVYDGVTGKLIKDDSISASDIPTGDEKDALAGTGTPSAANVYVTDDDSRLTDSRTPTGTAGGDLDGTYPNPTVDAITTTTGPTSLAIGAIADGEVLVRSGATVVGTSFTNSLKTKSGTAASGSFAGNPRTVTVAFSGAFASANFAVALSPVVTLASASYAPTVLNKTVNGFDISLGTSAITSLTGVDWIATLYGEN